LWKGIWAQLSAVSYPRSADGRGSLEESVEVAD
jgi:hypothetical protein